MGRGKRGIRDKKSLQRDRMTFEGPNDGTEDDLGGQVTPSVSPLCRISTSKGGMHRDVPIGAKLLRKS